jgi:hypothetical protein
MQKNLLCAVILSYPLPFALSIAGKHGKITGISIEQG